MENSNGNEPIVSPINSLSNQSGRTQKNEHILWTEVTNHVQKKCVLNRKYFTKNIRKTTAKK